MPFWKRYTWDRFESNALAGLEKVTDAHQKRVAREVDFDPAETFSSVLGRDWNGHSRGARVMLDTEAIAIETRERVPGSEKNMIERRKFPRAG